MSNPVFCELPHRHLIFFSGEDAGGFLHNLLTCDVNALKEYGSTYGGLCTPKGRLIATFLLWRNELGYVMQLPVSMRDLIQKRMSMYVLRSRVRLVDISASEVRIGVAGEGSGKLLESVFGSVPTADLAAVHASGATVIRLQADRYEIAVPTAGAGACREALTAGAAEIAESYWDWLDIRAGVPTILPPTQEEFVPQMVNLDRIGGVSFTKGCYPGQEIVARMHYLGRLKQRMYLAHIASDTAPQPGDRLYSREFGDQAAGMVVNAEAAPQGGYDALAVLQTASVAAGKVHRKGLDEQELTFLSLPYQL